MTGVMRGMKKFKASAESVKSEFKLKLTVDAGAGD